MTVQNIISDTDTLIALLNPEDNHNSRAENIVLKLKDAKASIYFPTTTIAEAMTTCQRKLNSPELAQQIVEACKAGRLVLLPVDEAILTLAITLFNPRGSKQDTFFDAIVAACAKHYQADAVFSFDGWYRKVGLKLTSDLFDEAPKAA
jgi:predicted nucleic acid-binding protein